MAIRVLSSQILAIPGSRLLTTSVCLDLRRFTLTKLNKGMQALGAYRPYAPERLANALHRQ